jgi:hypothetical protein
MASKGIQLARTRPKDNGRQRTERINKGLLSDTKNIAVDGLLRGIHVPVIRSKASWILDLGKVEENNMHTNLSCTIEIVVLKIPKHGFVTIVEYSCFRPPVCSSEVGFEGAGARISLRYQVCMVRPHF